MSFEVVELQNEKLRRDLEEERHLNASLRAECEELQGERDLWPAKERLAFAQGVEAMRRDCMAEFTRRAEALRVQQRTPPDNPGIVSRRAEALRLSADIAEQEYVAYSVSKLPAPVFGSEHTKEGH